MRVEMSFDGSLEIIAETGSDKYAINQWLESKKHIEVKTHQWDGSVSKDVKLNGHVVITTKIVG